MQESKTTTRALRLLAEKPATQVKGHELISLLPLLTEGWAEVTHQWNEVHNGKNWSCQKISITEAGRTELKRRQHA